ncbi:MAG: sugar-binding protein, partial [Planctomycetota bacterium]
MKRVLAAVVVGTVVVLGARAGAGESKPEGLVYKGRPAVDVPLVEKAPVLDGKLDDEAWAKATVLSFRPNSGKGDLVNKSEARVVSTKEALYIAVRCRDKDVSKVKAEKRDRDGETWQDDSVEIFLKSGEDFEKPYGQFTVNAKGSIHDSWDKDADWNAKGYQVAAGTEEKAWVVEAVIPFADLKLPEKKEELARGWRLDIFRNRQERDNEDMEDSAWSPTEDHS